MTAPLPPAPKRSRFQFHLATGVVLAFVAGGFVYRNTKPSDAFKPFERTDYGWPTVAYESYIEFYNIGTIDDLPENFVLHAQYRLLWYGILIDVAVALLLLGVTACSCEMWIVRSESARAAEEPAP